MYAAKRAPANIPIVMMGVRILENQPDGGSPVGVSMH
jgi:hypothetical protein